MGSMRDSHPEETTMDRRELLTTLGAGAAGLATLTQVAVGAEPEEHHHHRDKVHEDCMKACGECAKVCNETAAHCLEMLKEGSGDRKIHARVHSLTMDCQEFCVLSATLIARDSELMQNSCEACADACHECAEACDKHPAAEIVKECAEKCRTCERSCREMVRSMKSRKA
jgi:hypothetical protein